MTAGLTFDPKLLQQDENGNYIDSKTQTAIPDILAAHKFVAAAADHSKELDRSLRANTRDLSGDFKRFKEAMFPGEKTLTPEHAKQALEMVGVKLAANILADLGYLDKEKLKNMKPEELKAALGKALAEAPEALAQDVMQTVSERMKGHIDGLRKKNPLGFLSKNKIHHELPEGSSQDFANGLSASFEASRQQALNAHEDNAPAAETQPSTATHLIQEMYETLPTEAKMDPKSFVELAKELQRQGLLTPESLKELKDTFNQGILQCAVREEDGGQVSDLALIENFDTEINKASSAIEGFMKLGALQEDFRSHTSTNELAKELVELEKTNAQTAEAVNQIAELAKTDPIAAAEKYTELKASLEKKESPETKPEKPVTGTIEEEQAAFLKTFSDTALNKGLREYLTPEQEAKLDRAYLTKLQLDGKLEKFFEYQKSQIEALKNKSPKSPEDEAKIQKLETRLTSLYGMTVANSNGKMEVIDTDGKPIASDPEKLNTTNKSVLEVRAAAEAACLAKFAADQGVIDEKYLQLVKAFLVNKEDGSLVPSRSFAEVKAEVDLLFFK